MTFPNGFAPPPFVPHPFLRHSHAQTIAGGLGRPKPGAVARTEELTKFRIDDEVSLSALCNWQPERKTRTTVLSIHGLTGDARSSYMYGVAEKTLAVGMSSVRLNLRGCGDSEEASPTIYNSGVSDDVRAVLRELGGSGFERVVIVGFSMGGNIALKLAGELGAGAGNLLGLTAISPPIDLARCSDALDATAINRFYQRTFMRDLRRKLRHKHVHHPERFPIDGLDEVRSLREFDDRFTGPLGGYGDAAGYYEQCSAARFLSRVAVPALIVQARDDSFIPFEPFEDEAVSANAGIHLLATDRGGHNGFVATRPDRSGVPSGWHERGRFWAENRAVQFALHLERAEARVL